MNNGWIKIHRQIRDNWVWKKPEFLKAWIDLIMLMYYENTKVVINGYVHEIKRGERDLSYRYLAKRWGWSHGKIKRFLSLMQKDEMICLKNGTGQTVVSVCNYETYQVAENKTERKRNASGTEAERSKEVKEVKEDIIDVQFDEFWQLYPKKVGKKPAHNKYNIALKKTGHENIINSLKTHLKSWNGTAAEYIPHATTWLNQERWNDEIESKKEFYLTNGGVYKAYCEECGNESLPNKSQLKEGPSCHRGSAFVPEPPMKPKEKIDHYRDGSMEEMDNLLKNIEANA